MAREGIELPTRGIFQLKPLLGPADLPAPAQRHVPLPESKVLAEIEMNSQLYAPSESVSFKTPRALHRYSRFGAEFGKSASGAPPVPTTNWRTHALVLWPSASIGAKRW